MESSVSQPYANNYWPLFSRALTLICEPTSASNTVSIGMLLSDARMQGIDGRELLYLAMARIPKYKELPTPESFLNNNANIIPGNLYSGSNTLLTSNTPFEIEKPQDLSPYKCNGCNRTFSSQAALSAHGHKKCILLNSPAK